MMGNSIMNVIALAPNTMFLYELLHEPPAISQTDEAKKWEIRSFEKDICFKKVIFQFVESEKTLFDGLSFTLEKNKTTAIVGSSGSGKSTIINLLFRLFPLNNGCISMDDVNIENYTLNSYLSKFGYVSQETFIFNSTINENIRFGMIDCDEEMIIIAAKMANAHEFITETQDGYNTIVGDSGVKLSGGQRQRIAIARAMLRNPEIMVFDEATSSLDNISETKVQSAINQLSKYTTVLVIAHRLSTIIAADKILVLSDGNIIEEGKHQDLLMLDGEYSRLYQSQSNLT
jgi:ABC-type multidrug transport system fused ATPase/permease subunit